MKHRSNPFIVASLALVSATSLQAALFWNANSGAPDYSGTWDDVTTHWNTATAGAGAPATWVASEDAEFDANATYTVTVDAAQTATNLNIKAGSVSFAGTNTVSSTNLTIDSGATFSGAGDRYLKTATTALTVNGTLDYTAGVTTSTRRVSVAGGSGEIILGGTMRIGGAVTFAGNISGTGGILTDAGGIITLSGNNTYSGESLIRSGNTVRLGSATALSSNSFLRTGGGCVFELTGTNFSREIAFSGAGKMRVGNTADVGASAFGFAAVTEDRTVALTGTVLWGSTTFNPNVLNLGTAASTHKVTLTTDINLNAGSRTISTVNGSAAIGAEISGVLSGAAGSNLTKTGTGVLVLSNANTYVGTTTVSAGTLQIGHVDALGTIEGNTTVSSGATLALSGLSLGAEALTLAGIGVSDVGAIRSISGVNSMDGAVTLADTTRIGVDAGTLEMKGLFSGTKDFNAVGAGTLILSGGGTFARMIVGNSAVPAGGNLEWKAGTGTTAGSYFGVGDNVSAGFTMSGGSLTASPTSSLFVGNFSTSAVTGTMNVTGGTFAMGASKPIYVGGGGYNGNVSGNGILNVSNGTFSTGTTTGTFRMGANADLQAGNGEINLSGTGILETGRSITKGAQGTATVNFDGGTYKLRATQATMFGPGVVTNVNAGGLIVDTNTFNGTIGTDLVAGSPSGGLTKQGAGTLTLGGTNSYTGVTTLTAGTVSVATLGDGGVSGNLGAATNAATNIIFGGGTLQYSAATAASSDRAFTINAASSGTFNVSDGSGALTLTATVPTTTGVLYKTGNGEMTLDPGASSLSFGAISANGGNLILKTGTYATTSKDAAVSAYSVGAGARGGKLTIDGATLNLGIGNNLKIAATTSGSVDIKSGIVTSTELVIGHNGAGTGTQSGGTVTVTNLYHQDAGAGSSYTLSGGILTAARIFNNTAGVHDFTLNLNGGTLKSATGTTNLIDNHNTGAQISVLLGAGNTIIDTTASNATIVRPMGDMPSVAGTFTKAGENRLTLTAASTYTGGTTLSAGTLFANNTTDSATGTGAVTVGDGIGDAVTAILGGTGSIGGAITLDSDGAISPGTSVGTLTASSNVSGDGSLLVEVNGATADKLVVGGTLDISAMTLDLSITAPTESAYVIVDAANAITGAAFASVTGTIPSGYTLTYNYNDGVDSNNIALVSGGGDPFTDWATTTHGLVGGDALGTADPDNDGLDNLIEFVIGGQPNPANPNANSSNLAPTVSTDASNLIFTFRRTDLALTQPDIVIKAEYGSDLDGWTTATDGVGGVAIAVTDDIEAGVDAVQVSIPKALATGEKMFARLNVEIP